MDTNAFAPILADIEKELGVTIPTALREKLFERIALQKHDIQDQAFIEKILEDEEKTFVENFTGAFLDLAKNADLESFLSSTQGAESFIDIFIKNIDHLLNYFYNILIGAHLSGG